MGSVVSSCLVAELSDILKGLGRLNSISLELQYDSHNLLRYRYLLNRTIELLAVVANQSEDSLYPRGVNYYKSLAKCNLSLTNTLYTLTELKALTKSLTDRFNRVYMAYEEPRLKIPKYFINQLCREYSNKTCGVV